MFFIDKTFIRTVFSLKGPTHKLKNNSIEHLQQKEIKSQSYGFLYNSEYKTPE